MHINFLKGRNPVFLRIKTKFITTEKSESPDDEEINMDKMHTFIKLYFVCPIWSISALLEGLKDV